MACALAYSGVPGIIQAGLISTPVVSAAERRVVAQYVRPVTGASPSAAGSGAGSIGVGASGNGLGSGSMGADAISTA